jgi:hypothetical protein
MNIANYRQLAPMHGHSERDAAAAAAEEPFSPDEPHRRIFSIEAGSVSRRAGTGITVTRVAQNYGITDAKPTVVQFYGDKSGRVEDPYGHTWGLSQRIEDLDPDEMARRMAKFYEG